MSIDWRRFVELVQAHQRFILTSHLRPDCDALGSELGMAQVLAALGKEARIVNAQATPANLAFIDPQNRIQVLGRDVTLAELMDYDCLMVLDTSAWAQLGEMGDVIRATKAKKVILDHHISSDDLGAEVFRNTQAEATGRLVQEAARELGVQLTPEIARPLFAAIATDTGWLRFASTTGDTFRFAGALVDAGARPDAIYNTIYEQDTLARVQLRGRILARTQTELNGRLVFTSVTREDFEATGAAPADTEDVVNMTLVIAGTEVAVIFVEQQDGRVKVSFRSRAGLDCSRMAETFGGGGHKAAAGAMVPGPLATAEPRVLDAVRAAMR
ncbi:MAG TPA: DHH family phosphoesterase [Pirellulales bacterium]|nr:DHH family phosphoesterase [Pirellulales bacterium]